jgi:hypothetical protein
VQRQQQNHSDHCDGSACSQLPSLSLVIVAHRFKGSLVQSDLTGERERDALLLLGLLLADLPREGEETGDPDLDSDLQKVPETKFII